MTQDGVYFSLYLLGVAFQLAFGPRRQTALCCALGFITGLAIWVIAAAVVLVSPLRYTESTAIGAYLVPAGVCVFFAARRWRPSRRQLVTVAAWSAGAALLFLWLCSFDASRFSADSRHIVAAGLALTVDREPDLSYFAGKGSFQLLAHSMAGFTSDDYFYALSEAIGLSTVPVFILLGWRGLDRLGADTRIGRALVVAAALATVSTYNYTWHLVYVHTNIGSAVYLLACAGMLWLAELEDDTAYLPAVFLFLAAYTMHRIEGPLFTAMLILIGIFPSRLPRRALGVGLAFYAIPCALWYWYLHDHSQKHLTPTRALEAATCTIALLVVWLVASRTRWIALARHLPRLLALGLVLALVVGHFERHYEVSKTTDAMYENLIAQKHHMWGYAWYLVIGMWLLSLTAPRLPHGRVLSYGALLTFLGIVALGILHPFRIGPTDSANRMMIQVLPVALFYFTMQFVPLLTANGCVPGPRPRGTNEPDASLSRS